LDNPIDSTSIKNYFVEQLLSGVYDLFLYQKVDQQVYIILNEGHQYLLTNTTYTGRGEVKEQGQYQNQLLFLAVQCEALKKDIDLIKFDEQSISYLGNKIKAENRVEALNSLNKQVTKKSGNVETSLYIKDDYVDQKIKNLLIDEQVKFSTITLSFYQDNTISRLVVGNDNLSDYRPGFFQRAGLNFVTGWTIFKEMILIVVNLWMLILFAVLIYFSVNYYRKHRRPGGTNYLQF